MRINVLVILLISILIAGCAATGTRYSPPDVVEPGFSDVLQNGTDAASGEQGAITPEMLADWWHSLNDPILTELIHNALEGNLDLKEAKASVQEARSLLGISRAGWFPFLDVGAAYEKSSSSDNMIFSTGENDTYQAGFDAAWEIDIFGGVRRGVEAAQADLQARRENLKSVWVSLTGEVAQSYIALRTYQKRLLVAETNLENQIETYEILQSSFKAGLIDELDVQQARYNLERTRSTIPAIRSGLELNKNALAVLTGTMPGNLHSLLQDRKPIPVSSLRIITGIPANTLRQRPDIRAAERRLAAQTARTGQAKADLYPKFTLIGSIGLESIDSSSFFSSASAAWNIGPKITWPIFHAGSIRNNIQAQTAIQDQLLAVYEKTILDAIKEVRNALVDYAEEQNRRHSLSAAVQAAQTAVGLAQDKYKNGLVDFNNVLDAQRSLLSLEDQLALSEGAISTNLVRLYKALGGGWGVMDDDESPEPAEAPDSTIIQASDSQVMTK